MVRENGESAFGYIRIQMVIRVSREDVQQAAESLSLEIRKESVWNSEFHWEDVRVLLTEITRSMPGDKRRGCRTELWASPAFRGWSEKQSNGGTTWEELGGNQQTEASWKPQEGGKGFPGSSVVKNLLAGARDTSSIPGLGRSHMPGSN